MRAQTIDKFIKELKEIPEDKVSSLFDYMEFLKTKNKIKKQPNKETLKAMEDVDKKRNLVKSKDANDMFKKLGI